MNGQGPDRARDIDTPSTFDASEIRAAERDLAAALESAEATAWVYPSPRMLFSTPVAHHAVQGREALLAMAMAMRPLSSVSIEPLRTRVGKSGRSLDKGVLDQRGLRG